ncbi:MAG: class I SAM-dependent methyltransferase [Acidimicrobiales bacterium]
MGHITRLVLDPVMLGLIDPPGKNLLDIGCGEGYFARRLRDSGAARVVGVDISPEFIAKAREQDPNGEYAVGDVMTGPPQGTAVFDAVSAYMVLMYFPDLEAAYKSIAESLVPGGRFVACTANPYYAFPVGRWGRALRSGRYQTPESNRRSVKVIARQLVDVATGQFDWNLYLGDYFERRTVDKPLGRLTVRQVHRPLSDHIQAARENGLILDALSEPQILAEDLARYGHEQLAIGLSQLPLYLVLSFTKARVPA